MVSLLPITYRTIFNGMSESMILQLDHDSIHSIQHHLIGINEFHYKFLVVGFHCHD